MENLNINLSVKELTDMVKETVGNSIQKSLNANKDQIEKSIEVSLSLNRYYYCELKEEIIFVNLNIGANIKPPKDRVM